MSLWRKLALSVAAITISATPAIAQDAELTPKEIVEKSLDQNGLGFYSGVAKLRITVVRGKKKDTNEMLVESKEVEDDVANTRVTILEPADMAGGAYLFLGQTEREDDVYVYLPAFKTTRKVSGQDKKGAFLNTHMTYNDLESRDVEDGEAKRLDDEKIGPYECFVIETTAKDGDDSDYGKVVTFVRKKDYMPLRIEFYDKKGELEKRIFSEKISKDGDTRYVKKMSIKPEAGGSTTIEVLEVDFGADLNSKIFSKDALGE